MLQKEKNCFKTNQQNSHLFKVKSTNKCYYSKILLQDCNPISPDKNDFGDFPSKDASCFWIMPLYSPMLLTQYAPKTNSLCFLPCHLVFPMHLTHYAPKTRIRSLTTDSPRFGQKRKITIHCYYSPVTIHPSLFTGTIHCYCLLRNFVYLRGAVPYIWSKCFFCLVQDFFLRESLPLRAFLCENILAYYNFLPTLQSL